MSLTQCFESMLDRGRPRTSGALLLVSALAMLPAACGTSQVAAKGRSDSADQVERGRYLVTVMGCNDCHTPFVLGPNGPEPDMTRMLSGHPESLVMPPPPDGAGPWAWAGAATNTAFAGPWGVSYAINLTPDENTGIGIWTEEIFSKTLRTGKHWGVARPILPPMPWQNISQLTDGDLHALWTYLRSIPPVVNHVPDAAPPLEISH